MEYKMKKHKIFFLFLLFIITCIFTFSDEKSQFINVGNIKIIKKQLIIIDQEDIKININKKQEFEVETKYWFKNIDDINLRTTYLFSVDQYLLGDSRKYLKKIEFIDNYKTSKPSRAVIKFKDFDNNEIQREWYAISMAIPKNEERVLQVRYSFYNEDDNKFIYNFDLVKNFKDDNIAKVLIITVNNNSGKDLKKLLFQDYEFKKIGDNKYELALGDIKLQGNMEIELK